MVRTLVRRLTKTAVLGGLGYLVSSWFRGRDDLLDEAVPGTAQWPPLEPNPEPVDEPSDGSAADSPIGEWVEPDPQGDCPLAHPVKAKARSGIYHVPDGASYDRTNADRCYASAADAEADGYRASKT